MENQALVPGPLEARNVLMLAERLGRPSKEVAEKSLDFISGLSVRVMADNPKQIFSQVRTLAQRHNPSSYDASYLWGAIQERLPLATLDLALKRAVKKEHVALYRPR